MTSFCLLSSSHSRRLPFSSVAFLVLRPPPAPPPEPPSPPTPPEPPDPPDPQICLTLTFTESIAQPLSPLPSQRSSSSIQQSFPLLPDDSPFAIWFGEFGSLPCPTSSTTAPVSDVHYLAEAITLTPQNFPQVCSCCSPSNSSKMGRIWMLVELVALVLWNLVLSKLVLWNSNVTHSLSIGLDTFVSTFVLSCSTLTLIASMRSFTAVCGFYIYLAMFTVVLLQLGQSSLSIDNQPGFLVPWGFHSLHLSFMELIFLPNTSLVFSGIVIGSMMFKTVLLEVEARIVVQDYFRSAFADCLTVVSLEALFPPCGVEKDFQAKSGCFIGCSWADASLVELASSPLSQSLILSIVVYVSFCFCSTTLLVDVLVYSVLCSHGVSSLSRG
ncbi:hypothetical protein ISN45_Aa02g011740 [Arabidopsis thaliana x Arabidopsis arenosa]|uniref:Transmembrane protein n=1 Tax=Arabidopsis thaliana x Arabidopsis arenosa TaxID=1240361 RepID=A0A8T2BIJ9_9BRAS|nr:hypothetical protein ISN45_Aa02g011740 [Arabidopsis thaliana x Arabidopsis arenosa]